MFQIRWKYARYFLLAIQFWGVYRKKLSKFLKLLSLIPTILWRFDWNPCTFRLVAVLKSKFDYRHFWLNRPEIHWIYFLRYWPTFLKHYVWLFAWTRQTKMHKSLKTFNININRKYAFAFYNMKTKKLQTGSFYAAEVFQNWIGYIVRTSSLSFHERISPSDVTRKAITCLNGKGSVTKRILFKSTTDVDCPMSRVPLHWHTSCVAWEAVEITSANLKILVTSYRQAVRKRKSGLPR